MKFVHTAILFLITSLLWLEAATVAGEPISGVHFSKRVEASPRFNAKGMAWWNDRLIIVNREPAILHAFTSPDKFEILKKQGLTNPFGAAVDQNGNFLFTENKDSVLYRLARLSKDGKEETLLEETGVNHRNKRPKAGLCTPLMLATHPNGTIYWSGYPSTGTRYLLPGSKKFGLENVREASPYVNHSYGIGLSPKHDWLYVSSQIPLGSKGRGIIRYPVKKDGSLGKGELHVEIDLFTTTLNTPQNLQVLIPNAAVYGKTITNYSANETRRVDVGVGIGYEDNIGSAMQIIEEITTGDPRVLSEPATVSIEGQRPTRFACFRDPDGTMLELVQ